MLIRKITLGLGIVSGMFCLSSIQSANAQDVHFTQFNMQPLLLNPALTGAFQGDLRVNMIYRDQWRSVLGGAAFKTYALSVDAPLIRDISIDDYLAGGIQLYNDVAGDGNLSNFTALGSVAYHKFLGLSGNKALTVGLQGGYTQRGLDISKLYFGDEFLDGVYQQGTTWEQLASRSSGWLVNAGLAWSHSISPKFSYILGGSVQNITRPLESLNKRDNNSEVGRPMRYTGQLGMVIGVGQRLYINPAFLYQSQANASELVGGMEFNYKLGDDPEAPTAPAIFLGTWYRLNDAAMATAGVEWQGFRLGFAYDYNISKLKSNSNGNGGLEVALRYTKANPIEFARRLIYPCGRF